MRVLQVDTKRKSTSLNELEDETATKAETIRTQAAAQVTIRLSLTPVRRIFAYIRSMN